MTILTKEVIQIWNPMVKWFGDTTFESSYFGCRLHQSTTEYFSKDLNERFLNVIVYKNWLEDYPNIHYETIKQLKQNTLWMIIYYILILNGGYVGIFIRKYSSRYTWDFCILMLYYIHLFWNCLLMVDKNTISCLNQPYITVILNYILLLVNF